MNILILEDESEKLNFILKAIKEIKVTINIVTVNNLMDFMSKTYEDKYDLIIVDLLVPRFEDSIEAEDVSNSIIEITQNPKNKNFYTYLVALSQYADEQLFTNLNNQKIIVITYSYNNDWKSVLISVINDNLPRIKYDFIIICALEKETYGFIDAGFQLGEDEIIHGLNCNKFSIKNLDGLIITCPRMGLVTASIISAKVIEIFQPKIICMSGICAGVSQDLSIYDIVIPDTCHQHDSGKWGDCGFESEYYSVQLHSNMRAKIKRSIKKLTETLNDTLKSINLDETEYPEGINSITPHIRLATTSSGSAVIADKKMNEIVRKQHRKTAAFEMETFAVYESARLSTHDINYFSAKCIVDDGGVNKNDSFHRIACILSAKVVHEIISECF